MTAEHRKQMELEAMKRANSRPKGLRFASMLFDAAGEALLLEWERGSWHCRWFEKHAL